MKKFYIKYKIQLDKLIFMVIIFASIYVFLHYVLSYILPFFIAFIFSLLLDPIADFFCIKIKAPRWFASLMCILLLVFVILFIGTSIVSRIILEAQSFTSSIPDLITKITDFTNDTELKFNNLFSFIPNNLKNTFSNVGDSLLLSITSTLSSLVKVNSFNIVAKIPKLLIGIVLTLISTFFFINDKKLIHQVFIKYTPLKIVNNIKLIRQDMFAALIGYVKAQLIIMSVIGVISITSLYIIQHPYALVVALVIAFFDALPLFGSGFILWPWIAFCFMINDYYLAVRLLIIYAIIFITRQIIEPRILGKQIGIHPLITLISIYVGLKLFGVLGILIGPFSVILAKTIFMSEATTSTESIITKL